MPDIIVHWLSESRAHAVIWALEELEVPYTIKKYSRAPYFAPEELKKVHPLGKSPVIEIVEGGESVVLAETGAILEYLVETFGNGRFVVGPNASRTDQAKERYWKYFPESSAFPPAFMFVLAKISTARLPWYVRTPVEWFRGYYVEPGLRHRSKPVLEFTEASLSDQGFLFGSEPTLADFEAINAIVMFLILQQLLGEEVSPKLYKFVEQVRRRPAYQRAVEKTDEGLISFGEKKLNLKF